MSKIKQMIEIEPSRLTPGGKMAEVMESKGHKCPYCQGNGYFWKEDDCGEPYKDKCSMCGGSGKLDAVVTVEWKASVNS